MRLWSVDMFNASTHIGECSISNETLDLICDVVSATTHNDGIGGRTMSSFNFHTLKII
jgi:hypothetical protein